MRKIAAQAPCTTHIDEGHHRGSKLFTLWEAEGEGLLALHTHGQGGGKGFAKYNDEHRKHSQQQSRGGGQKSGIDPHTTYLRMQGTKACASSYPDRWRQAIGVHLVQDLLLALGLPHQVGVCSAAGNEVLQGHRQPHKTLLPIRFLCSLGNTRGQSH